MADKFELDISITGGQGVPPFQGTLRRTNVIMGANGTGKSKLLNRIRDQALALALPENVIYVEGGRVVTPPDTVQLDRNTFGGFQTITSARSQHGKKRSGFLRDRTHVAFLLLKKIDDENKLQHSDKVEEWRSRGKVGDVPRQPRPPLKELFELFHSVFPEITLEMVPESLTLQCTKGGAQYAPSGLSDGEKQALCLLADIALLADKFSLIIVDEPELNLHPHLAEDLWHAIELRYPECVFIYATHSISFSLRSHVEAVFVLGKGGGPALAIDSPLEMDQTALRPFLGAIPAILASDRCLIVEGTDKSFDAVFYRWVVNSPTLVIEPVGGSSEVAGAAKGAGIWDRIAPTAKLLGVIDRDFRGDDALRLFGPERLLVLELHEAESYLCDPNIIHAVAIALGTIEPVPTVDEITSKIFDFAKESIRYVAVQRAFLRLSLPLRPSLRKQQTKEISNDAELVEKFRGECSIERNKAITKYNEEATTTVITEELERCKAAVGTRNIGDVLRIFEGKELLAQLHKLAACSRPEAVARAAKHHLNIDDFPRLANLRNQLSEAMQKQIGTD